ncbi:hypothetical protein Aple_015320 [Acrocarpospora pleiomorpha]|uniref:Uncharacterized protein n=1 Tax=Acrocarpospora pleiomorpha TaxID=90975 RepID=A0A5M3XAA4_9ACTN|nr:hypothetical protein Aple_015320 [Acrocarpospora pleiomorpha]
MPLQDEVRHTAVGQMLTHRQAGLAPTDDEDLDCLTQIQLHFGRGGLDYGRT